MLGKNEGSSNKELQENNYLQLTRSIRELLLVPEDNPLFNLFSDYRISPPIEKIATVAFQLQQQGAIISGIPIPNGTAIDHQGINFIFETTKNQIIPVAVVNDPKRGNVKRKNFSERYGNFRVGVVQTLTITKNHLDNNELKNTLKMLRTSITSIPVQIPSSLRTQMISATQTNPITFHLLQERFAPHSSEKATVSYDDLIREVNEYLHRAKKKYKSLANKFELIHSAGKSSDRRHEEETGIVLTVMNTNGQILNWYPTKAHSPLDYYMVDFLVEVEEDIFLPLQVAARPKHHQRKIKDMHYRYGIQDGEKLPIGIVRTLTTSKKMKSREQIMEEILLLQQTVLPIKLDTSS